MKTQLLTTAFAATLMLAACQTSHASNLNFAVSTLNSAHRTYARTGPDNRQLQRPNNAISHPANPIPRTEPQLLLGAYLTDIETGLQVTGTVPGSPASKSLQKGDIVRRVAALGQPTCTINTLNQFEYAKRAIGSDRQAVLEIYRPGAGLQYVWVTFRPAGELARFSQRDNSSSVSMFNPQHDNHVGR